MKITVFSVPGKLHQRTVQHIHYRALEVLLYTRSSREGCGWGLENANPVVFGGRCFVMSSGAGSLPLLPGGRTCFSWC